MPTHNNSRPWFSLLDVLRGPAAILVFAEHWRNLLFIDFPELVDPGIGLKLFYLFSGAGREAVMIFFVLSGCVIAHVTSGMFRQDRWSWPAYLSARLTRLWVVLLPALLLTAFWDKAGIYLSHGRASIYSGNYGSILIAPVVESLDFMDFVGNFFFLQKILVPAYGSNGPLWSISYEFVYYLAFPLIFIAFRQLPKPNLSGLCSLALAIGLLFGAGWSVCQGFFIFLMGVFVYFLYRFKPFPVRFSVPGFAFGVVLTLSIIVASRMQLPSGILSWEVLLGLSTAIAIYAGLSARPSASMDRVTEPLQKASAVSYSMYLFHTPLLVFFASLLFRSNSDRWQPDIMHLSLGAIVALLVIGYCLIGWYFTERRTKDIRSLLSPFTAAQ
jgi:peptidoglycan/LPS O-acetylase OafA/YrhL